MYRGMKPCLGLLFYLLNHYSAKLLKGAPGCLFLNLKLGAVLCGTMKCKASRSVSHLGVICEGLVPNTAMAMEQWPKNHQALINTLPSLRFCETEGL